MSGRSTISSDSLRDHGLGGGYCLLYHANRKATHDLDGCVASECRSASCWIDWPGQIHLLNLSYSIHPPLLLKFERRIILRSRSERNHVLDDENGDGPVAHHEFWTIGLNVNADDCGLPKDVVAAVPAALESSRPTRPPLQRIHWKTFFPLADTKLLQPKPRPRSPKFTTIGQWYWGGAVEVDGDFPDLSKKYAFEPYLDLPKRVPAARFELAMNMNPDDPERQRVQDRGWQSARSTPLARTPSTYRRYLASALGEFTAIKGVDVSLADGLVERSGGGISRNRTAGDY